MVRSLFICGLACLLIGGFALGQPPHKDAHALAPPPDPRALRQERDRIIAATGESVRDFVETYGEDAVAAISECSRDVARRLGQFPDWNSFPRPGALLRAIGRPNHGDDVATWVLAHAKELTDPDSFEAFIAEPLSYALSLKKLPDGAAYVQRLRAAWHARQADERNKTISLCAVLAAAGYFAWRRKRDGGF